MGVTLTAILRAQLIQELTGHPVFKVSQAELVMALADEDETTRALAELVIERRRIQRTDITKSVVTATGFARAVGTAP